MAPGHEALDRLQQALGGDRQAQSVPATKHVPYWQQKGQEGVTKSLPHFIWARCHPATPFCSNPTSLHWRKELDTGDVAEAVPLLGSVHPAQYSGNKCAGLAWPVPTWGGPPLGSNPQSHCPLYLSCQCRGRQGTQFWLHFRASLVLYWGVTPPAPPKLISAPLSMPVGH